MIKNLLLPEKIGFYYLFSKRIVGFSFNEFTVSATQVYLKGLNVTVEQVFNEEIIKDQDLSYEERVAIVVKNILDRVGNYDSVYTVISSSKIIFKTLKLPFLRYEKIKMVVNYEVEPLLPFALDESVIDFIITDQSEEEGSSEILVAAVQKSYIAEHILYFEQAGVSPSKIGVDLFSLYSLYKKIDSYNSIKGNVALIDVGFKSTRIAFINDSKLKSVRVVSKGINDFIKSISKDMSISREDAYKELIDFGLTKKDNIKYYDSLVKSLKSFLSLVQFTLSSFISDKQDIVKFVFSGQVIHITGFNDFVTDQTSIPSEPFQFMSILTHKNIKIKKNVFLLPDCLIGLGIVFPSQIIEEFNLLPKYMFVEKETLILAKQIFLSLFFLIVVFGLLITHSFLQIKKLSNELKSSQNDVISILKDRFSISEEDQDFDEIVEAAEREVIREENVWSPFSARSHFLKYLLELRMLDLENIGFKIDRVSFNNKEMVLKARVKDFPSLSKLEKELRLSKLFKYEGSEQKTDFIIKIKLNRNL